MKIGVILKAKECEKAWNAFRFAATAKKQGYEVKIFLMGEVFNSEISVHGKYNVDEQLKKFINCGGEILACENCLKKRRSENTEFYPVSSTFDCVQVMDWADKRVTF